MTDLVTTGPPAIGLRWSQEAERRPDGHLQREFFPASHLHEARGYLHPGIAAAGLLGGTQLTTGLPSRVGGLSMSFEAPVPLGMDLTAVGQRAASDGLWTELQVLDRPDVREEPVRTLARGEIHPPSATPSVPDEGAFRAAASSEVPQPRGHELYRECFVCGQDNPRGLDLRPAWQAPDTVVTAFTPSQEMLEGDLLTPHMSSVLLSCPTLWACAGQLEQIGSPAALLATYEVAFLEDVRGSLQLRTVGLAGEPEDGLLHGRSALIGEDGRLYATATASWQTVDRLPAREPGRPEAARTDSVFKGGRPETGSDPDYGQPLPGRRETPGPRSERVDHDDRDAMGLPVDQSDPSAPRRSLTEREHG